MPSRPFYLLATFWGERYRRWFCRFAVASFLAPNNVPLLRGTGSKFLICTTDEDWAALQEDASFRALRQYIEPVHLLLPEGGSTGWTSIKYGRMSIGHKLMSQRCHADNAYGIFTNVDSLYHDGTIKAVMRLAELGRKVVWATAIRFDLDAIERELAAQGRLVPGKPIVLPNREAVALGLRHLHREAMCGDWDSAVFGELASQHGRAHFPTCCFWRVPRENGVVIVTHNWAPILLDYGALPDHDTTTLDHWAIDGDYIFKNFGATSDFLHIAQDSDELFMLGMTPADEMVPDMTERWWKTYPLVAEAAKGCILNHAYYDVYLDPLRRQVYPTLVRWHSRDLSAAWQPVEQRAAKLVARHTQTDYRLALARRRWSKEAFLYPLIYGFSRSLMRPPLGIPRFLYVPYANAKERARVIARCLAGDPEARVRARRGLARVLARFK